MYFSDQYIFYKQSYKWDHASLMIQSIKTLQNGKKTIAPLKVQATRTALIFK